MEQRPNDAAVKDAIIKPSGEECASSTGQSEIDAAAKDVLIKSDDEDWHETWCISQSS